MISSWLLLLQMSFAGNSATAMGIVPQSVLHVRVSSAQDHKAIPCRITIVDSRGRLALAQVAKDPHLAVRTGVVYTSTGAADISLPAGEYTVYATRGPMYGL